MGGLDQVLKDLIGGAERLLPTYLDYQNKNNQLDTVEAIYGSRYGNGRYSSYGMGYDGEGMGSLLPLLLIAGAVVAVVVIAK